MQSIRGDESVFLLCENTPNKLRNASNKMGTTGQSVTLANSIIGVGILAMPFCFQQCGAALAVLMLLMSALVSRLACYFLLKSAILARRRNFEFLAFHVFGAPGKLAVEVGIIGFLMGTCIAYFVVIGDLGPQIICKMFNVNQSDVLRTCVMVVVSLVCVLPLGLLRNVDSLSNVSAATIGFYFCLIIKVIAEATSQLFTGNWWNKIELWKPEGVLQCVPIFSMALFCQTQLFEIFETLPSLSLEKMSVVTKSALNICTMVYLMVGMFGYIAFCSQPISGNILVSLSPTMASDVIKLGFVMSLAFSFPLIIFPCRASLYSLLYRKVLPSHHDHIINHSIPEGTFKCITVCIIVISLLVSLMIPNIELVLGLVGSTIGVMICVLFPSACFVSLTLKNTNERLLAKMIMCLGIVVMVLGTYANLQAADSKREHYDDRYITQDKIDKIVHDFFETNKDKFKSEDAIIKPEIKPPEENVENNVIANILGDSEVQPPNPVAPDPQSNNNVNIPPKAPQIVAPDKTDKLKQNEIEGAGDKEATDNNKTESEEKSINAIKDTVKDNVKNIIANSALNQDHLKILKQQQLIETIKQHGQEQKELIKEQKEILDQMKKTKLEIEMKKKESIEKEQANKIAAESIQKIANIAIQSLTGDKINDAKPENSAVDGKKQLNEKSSDIKPPNSSMNEGKNKIDGNSEQNQQGIGNNNVKINQIDPEIKLKDSNVVVGNANKEHVNSVDEPNAHAQHGDDERPPSKIDALLNNVPVPLIMNQKFQNNPSQVNDNLSAIDNRALPKLQPNSVQYNANLPPPINEKSNEKVHSREKRDIGDCAEQITDEKDGRKCVHVEKTNLLDRGIDIKIPQKLSLPDEVNLGKVDVLQQRHLDLNMHHSRALKSVVEEPS